MQTMSTTPGHNQVQYTTVVMRDGSVKLAPTQPAIVGKDGYMLYNSNQVTTASSEELRKMRKELFAYNNDLS